VDHWPWGRVFFSGVLKSSIGGSRFDTGSGMTAMGKKTFLLNTLSDCAAGPQAGTGTMCGRNGHSGSHDGLIKLSIYNITYCILRLTM
jgi:hypothetical protein